MPVPIKPTALGKQIGTYLRDRRKQAGLSGFQISQRLGWTTTKTSRVENGIRWPSNEEITMYLSSCGAKQDEVDSMIGLAAQRARYRAIEHTDATDDETDALAFFQKNASTVENYEQTSVPVLLRTESYARVLFAQAGVRSEEIVNHRLDGMYRRQAILRNDRVPTYTWYIHENVLHAAVGNDLTMNDQLLHMTFLGAWQRCTIRIVPRAAAGSAMVANAFDLFNFTDLDPLVTVCLETNELVLEDLKDTRHYRRILNRLNQVALDEDESLILVANIANQYDISQQ